MLKFINTKTPSILVVGDLMIDYYLWGSTKRISPEAPVQIVNINKETSVLGGAGNVVKNLKSLGADVDIISVTGNCEISNELRQLITEINVKTDFLISEDNRISSKKTRIISSNQQVIRYDKETISPIAKSTENKVIDFFTNQIRNYDIVLFSDYGKGLLTENVSKNLISIAKENSVKVLVDPKGKDYSKYEGAYLLTPNLKEASEALGISINPDKKDSLEGALSLMQSQFKLSKSIITLSESGIALFDQTFKIFPTHAKEVFDVTGAGDTVLAALGFYLANDDSIEKAIEFANIAAGIVVGKIGAACVTMIEVEDYLAKPSKIKTFEEISAICEELRILNKKIVFTNGCFDLLHSGHTKYLSEAKQNGDILIVGINSDESVRKLKGNDRPIVSEDDRSEIIASLAAVDYVVIFNESTPINLIKKVMPDVLIKGSDYKLDEIIGSEIAKETKTIEFVAGKSTSKIIEKIKSL